MKNNLKIKCYVNFTTEQNNVNDGKAGRKDFDTLPVNTYFLSGYQNESDKGKATLFCFDSGTCLTPIFNAATNEQICYPELEGKEITREGKLKIA